LSHNEPALNAHYFSLLRQARKLTCNLAEHLDHLAEKQSVSSSPLALAALGNAATPPIPSGFQNLFLFNVRYQTILVKSLLSLGQSRIEPANPRVELE